MACWQQEGLCSTAPPAGGSDLNSKICYAGNGCSVVYLQSYLLCQTQPWKPCMHTARLPAADRGVYAGPTHKSQIVCSAAGSVVRAALYVYRV